jgi:hypothetical protein
MNKMLLLAAATALAVPAAWAATTINAANAPSGTHVQSGTPSCQVVGYVVTCSSYDLAGVGNNNATGELSATYNGTVICTNPAGNVAPGQTKYPTIKTSTGSLSPKNGRLTVPPLSSTTDDPTIEAALMEATKCPNGKWDKSVQDGSIVLVGYTYKLSFTGFSGPYILITG